MVQFVPRAIRFLKAFRPAEVNPTSAEMVEMGKAVAYSWPADYKRLIGAMDNESASEFPDAEVNPDNVPEDLFDLIEQGTHDGTPGSGTPIASINEYLALNLLEGKFADIMINAVARYRREVSEPAGAAAATETIPQIESRRKTESEAAAKTIVKG